MSEIYPIAVPKWGIEMIEGTLNTWNKREGDSVSKGDEVFDMESDKIVNVWESPVNGVLRRIIAPEGDARPVGALLGVIAAAEVSDAEIDAFIANYATGETQEAAPKSVATSAGTGPNDAMSRTNPVVRQLAEQLGVDLNEVVGTGRRGRITQDDVQAAAAESTGPDDDTGVQVIPLSATRRTIARRLTEAKQSIPHFYLTAEYELDGLVEHRKRLNAGSDNRVSLNDLIIACVAQALVREPRVNVNLVGDEIHQFEHANISVAVATEDGLYPVTIRNANSLSVSDIAQATGALAEKAQKGKLTQEDISGGSFTVSNLGMFGVTNFTAIINPPMGAILALGKAEQKVVAREGSPAVATMISATLSCDHRVIDGAVGARFLQVLADVISEFSH